MSENIANDVTDVTELMGQDLGCFQKARVRGDDTFTLVGQDRSAPSVVCEWIKQNIESAPPGKLRQALEHAITMRGTKVRKQAD